MKRSEMVDRIRHFLIGIRENTEITNEDIAEEILTICEVKGMLPPKARFEVVIEPGSSLVEDGFTFAGPGRVISYQDRNEWEDE